MAVVLAIITVLAAVLTPILTGYIERAKDDAARWDLKTIAAAIIQYNTDTRAWPIYQTHADIPIGDVFNVLRGPGDLPTVSPVIVDWPIMLGAVNGTTSLNTMLNTNFLGFSTLGSHGWKGAYLELGADPWGSSYLVTAATLRPDSANAAYVISAGPNQTIDTIYAQGQGGPLVVGGDDLVQRVK